ncbi:hypothetical protein HZB01_05415 [Candidatus Woesearchaeota archaeon]|nr:hypothetical protein [Candidatus Woesearchaeota archaeon]
MRVVLLPLEAVGTVDKESHPSFHFNFMGVLLTDEIVAAVAEILSVSIAEFTVPIFNALVTHDPSQEGGL